MGRATSFCHDGDNEFDLHPDWNTFAFRSMKDLMHGVEAGMRSQHCVILPGSRIKSCWDAVVGLLLVYTATMFPFKLCFLSFRIALDPLQAAPDETPPWYVATLAIDLLFWMDLAVSFFVAYRDNNGVLVTSHWLIARKYLCGFFVLDFIACLPPAFWEALILFLSGVNDVPNPEAGKALRLMRIGRLARLTRLMRLSRIIKVGARVRSTRWWAQVTRTRGMRIAKFVVSLVFAVHLLACGWYLVASVHNDVDSTWVARRAGLSDGFLTASPAVQWLHSMYFVFTVFTTVGFGDIYAVTSAEILYTLFTMIVGAVVHSIFVSEMINIVTDVDEAQLDHARKTELVVAFCRHAGVPESSQQFMTQQLGSHHDGMLRYDRSQMHMLVSTNVFPRSITDSLAESVFHGDLKRSLFFSRRASLEPRALLTVAIYAVRRTLQEGQAVYHHGDYPHSMYFVMQGTLAAVGHLPLKKNSPCGEPDSKTAIGEQELKRSSSATRWKGFRLPRQISRQSSRARSSTSLRNTTIYDPDSHTNLWPYTLYSRLSYFGEYELLHNVPRTTTMRCESAKAEVLMLPQKALSKLLSEYPALRTCMVRESSRREAHRRLRARTVWGGLSFLGVAATTIKHYLQLKMMRKRERCSAQREPARQTFADVVTSSENARTPTLPIQKEDPTGDALTQMQEQIREDVRCVVDKRLETLTQQQAELEKKQDELLRCLQDLVRRCENSKHML